MGGGEWGLCAVNVVHVCTALQSCLYNTHTYFGKDFGPVFERLIDPTEVIDSLFSTFCQLSLTRRKAAAPMPHAHACVQAMTFVLF